METLIEPEKQVTIEPEQQVEVPSVHEFRAWFDRLKCPLREKVLLELLYLTASRESEICKKVLKWEVEHSKALPYGELFLAELQKYQMPNGEVIPILLLRLGVAKHRVKEEKILRGSTEEISQNSEAVSQIKYQVKVRYVPIPLKIDLEPWALDILKFLQKGRIEKTNSGKVIYYPEFDCTRRTIYNIVRRNLAIFEPKIHPHLLRHYRTSHLLQAYNFSPLELTSFVGWSIQTTSKQLGMPSSAMLDVYAHLQWRDYIQKLLVPLSEVS